MKAVSGGVSAALGFTDAGIHCGVKKSSEAGDGNQPSVASMETFLQGKKDLALIVSDRPCAAAGVFTKNRVKAAPVLLCMEHLRHGRARAIIANSGNANACAPHGEENARKMAELAAGAVGCAPEEVLVSSTGVIGQTLNIAAIERGMPALVAALGNGGAAEAIMTTDTVKKERAYALEIDGKPLHIGGICKGSGMIHPNMGTMLCYITTDAQVDSALLQSLLRRAVAVSFNRVSVDGDTSTNDSCILLANGASGVCIEADTPACTVFYDALQALCIELAREIAADGEGATHLITCTVEGADTEAHAEALAKSVISSSLTKAAVFGADANWGRVICAMGYSGIEFDPERVSISFASRAGCVPVCENGRGLPFDEAEAKRILSEREVVIQIRLSAGEAGATCWGCDLTYEYVKINGDYRT